MKKGDARSVIQEEFNDLLLTGNYAIHHVFPGNGRRKLCEKYGFLVAVRPEMHREIHDETAVGQYVSDVFRRECYEFYLEHIGTKEQFVAEFGGIPKSYWEIAEAIT